MVRGALPLGTNLQHRGINTNGLCPHCLEPETALHLFFICPYARQVWDLAPLRATLDFSTTTSLLEAFTAMSSLVCLPPTGITSCVSSWILWGLWTARNSLIFENRSMAAKVTIGKALASASEWHGAQVKCPKTAQLTATTEEPPTIVADTVTCNSVAAWSALTLRA